MAPQHLFRLPLGPAVDLDRLRFVLLGHGPVEALGPQAVRGDEHELAHVVLGGGSGDHRRPFDVGPPEEVLVLHGMGEDGGAVEDGVKTLLGEQPLDESRVSDVTEHRAQPGMRPRIGLKVDAHAVEPVAEQPSFEHVAEEAGATGDQDAPRLAGALARSLLLRLRQVLVVEHAGHDSAPLLRQ